MNRVILVLAIVNFALAAVTAGVGLASDPPSQRIAEERVGQQSNRLSGRSQSDKSSTADGATNLANDPESLGHGAFRYHFELGILTSLFTMFAQCLVFTYFLGTTRWVRETATAYSLGEEPIATSRRLRSRTLAYSMTGVLLVVLTVATGAGADTHVWPTWLHQLAPLVTFGFLIFAYRQEIAAIEAHVALTDDIMNSVDRVRAERGLAPL